MKKKWKQKIYIFLSIVLRIIQLTKKNVSIGFKWIRNIRGFALV